MEFDKHEWRALLAFACTKFNRPHICGITVWEHAAASTDGHTAILCCESGTPTTDRGPGVFVTSHVASMALKIAKGDDRIRIEDGEVCVGAVTVGKVNESIHTTPFHAVMKFDPQDKSATRFVGLNPRYLARLNKLHKLQKDGIGVRVMIGGPLDPVHVETTCASKDWRAIIMPIKM